MRDLWQDRKWTPMLLGEVFKPFDSSDYLFEIKFDGIRALIFVDAKEIKIYNRYGKEMTKLYPELKSICKLVKNKTIFDGEIIAMENGLPSFQKLQGRVHLKSLKKINLESKNNPVVFVCFDILYDNKNIVNLPLIRRKKILQKCIENDNFIISKYIETNGLNLYKKITKLNLEGIVAKRKDSRYVPDERSNNWLKIKNFKSGEFLIGGYIEKEANFVISLVLGEYINNNFNYVGKVTLGKKSPIYQQVKKQRKLKKSPFNNYNENVQYIKPSIKCKIKYMERTKNNRLRQPFISK